RQFCRQVLPKFQKAKGFDKRLILAPLVLAVIVLGGFFGYRYVTQAKQIDSIAVMPFVNESGNPDGEYLSDGMTETLINSLSQIPNVNVKARSSVFRYKGKEIDPKKVASELGVQAILTGRVLQRGDQLTLSVELIDGQTENTIWGNKYERKGSDLALQSEVARDVSGKLKAKLSGADAAKVEKSYTANPEAYQLYLKGRFAWNKRTGPAIKQAADLFKQAIEKDPNYALAYSGLAETYVIFSSYGVALAKDSMPQAKAAALRALELMILLRHIHLLLANIFSTMNLTGSGEREFRRAIELNPKYPTARQWLGNLLASVKRYDESLVELRRAEELDPLSPIIAMNVGDTLVNARRYDEAHAVYKRSLTINPDFALTHFAIGWAYGLKGMYPEAIAETRKAIELDPDSSTKGYLALWLGRSGAHDEARKVLDEIKQESTQRYVQSFSFALAHLGLGEKGEALNWLEKEIAERGAGTRYYANAPELDDVQAEPRFKAMLKQLNLPE
ncbi:MAG: tetratricopeptide repeat protein, partial [Acidobacteria bacterium]|nr:tetratricopeptide repeat protein [Acidobacteriota bacterium]